MRPSEVREQTGGYGLRQGRGADRPPLSLLHPPALPPLDERLLGGRCSGTRGMALYPWPRIPGFLL